MASILQDSCNILARSSNARFWHALRGCLHGGGPALLVGLAVLDEISLLTTKISPRRAGNFHINTLKRAGPPRRASKSKLRRHNKGCLDQHFLDNFSFHKLCLFTCIGYKMKTNNLYANIGFRVSALSATWRRASLRLS